MAEDNDKKVIYLCEVLEKCEKDNDLKVVCQLFRKQKGLKDFLGLDKRSSKPKNQGLV